MGPFYSVAGYKPEPDKDKIMAAETKRAWKSLNFDQWQNYCKSMDFTIVCYSTHISVWQRGIFICECEY